MTINLLFLWMCHTPWDGQVYLDRRMQFGDKSTVEGFQSVTNLLLRAAQAVIDGDAAMRATVPHAAHLWQYIDARPTNEAYRRWEPERLNEFGEGPQLRLNHTDGYIGGFMGAVYGRRRSCAVATVHRAFIGKGGADFPLKASKEYLPMPSMVALGGSLDIDSGLATLPDERAARYSAQTQEVLDSTRFDSDEFHQYTSRLVVSAAQYEPAGRAWLVSSFCTMRQARRRSTKKGRRTRVFAGPGVKSEAHFWLRLLSRPAGIALVPRLQFSPSDDPRRRIGWFSASASWGMANKVKDGRLVVVPPSFRAFRREFPDLTSRSYIGRTPRRTSTRTTRRRDARLRHFLGFLPQHSKTTAAKATSGSRRGNHQRWSSPPSEHAHMPTPDLIHSLA